MRKLLLTLILFAPASAWAQGARFDSVAMQNQGSVLGPVLKAIPSATITVCTSAGAGTPCAPTTTIYTSQTLVTTSPNPFNADGNGNFGFWAPPGRYTYSITGGGVTGQIYAVTVAGDPTVPLQIGSTFYVGSATGLVTAPSTAPAVAVESASGGSIAAGTYYCVLTYKNLNGETTRSPEASVTTTGATSQIRINPGDALWLSGAWGMNAYCGTVTGGPYFLQTPKTVSFAVANNGFVRTSNVVTVTFSANHGLTKFSSFTVAGATGCGVSPNGTFTMASVLTATSITYTQTAANDAACGGASATASYNTALSTFPNTHYISERAGGMDAGAIILTTIAGSGTQPLSSNTATTDAIQVAIQSARGTISAGTESRGSVQLGAGDIVLTTPLILGVDSPKILGHSVELDISQSGSVTARGSRLTCALGDPNLACVMIMGRAADLRNLAVVNTADGNAIMYVSGALDMNGQHLKGVYVQKLSTGSTFTAPIRIHHVREGHQWVFDNVTTTGGRIGGLYASNSNVAMLDWKMGRMNCGSDPNSSATLHVGGPGDLDRGVNFAGLPTSVGYRIRTIDTESCRGIVFDHAPGTLELLEGTTNSDGAHVAGTEAIIKLDWDGFATGSCCDRFRIDSGTRIFGSTNANTTIKVGNVMNGVGSVGQFIPNVIQNSMVAASGTGVSVDLNGANLGASAFLIINAQGIQCETAGGTVINRVAPGNYDTLACINTQGINDGSGVPKFWSEVIDRLMIRRQVNRATRSRTFDMDTATSTDLLKIFASDGVTVDASDDASGNWTFRGQVNPATNGNSLGTSANRWAGLFTTGNFNGQITSTLATGTAPLSITSTTPVANLSLSGGSGTAVTTSTLTVAASFATDGGGFKHKRGAAGCATAASAGAVCTTTVTWTTAFADANYTAQCGGRLVTSGVPLNGGLTAQVAASVTFQTVAATAVAAQFTNVDCIAVHD